MNFIQLMQSSLPALVTMCVLLGLLMGSFINVVIFRLPRMLEREWRLQAIDLLVEGEESAATKEPWVKARAVLKDAGSLLRAAPRYDLVVPRSACPSCGHHISALENIPVLSFLILRGQCAGCKSPISVRYPVVELVSAVLAGVVAWRFGFSMATLGALVLMWCLLALTLIDVDTQLLPDDITLPLVWAGLLFNLSSTFVPIATAVTGAIAGYLTLWSVYWLFKFATGREGMGYGDFKLLAALGAWLGWKMLPQIILLSSLVGAVVGIGLMVLAKRGRHVPIPFGPYLAAAGLISLFWGESINQAYLHLI
jgi:leader peptidase (prepilin peptidase)/N-methyltransferase